MGYIIGSFNTCHFSGFGTHDINMMARIIREEEFDIVALQEVKRQRAVESLKERLDGWDGHFGISAYNDLGFGYLWNTRRVRECSGDGQPVIFQDYNKWPVRMTRDPCYARFTPSGLGGPFIEIRLIDVHIPSRCNLPRKVEEFQLVTERILDSIGNHRLGNFMAAYTIILGDYNLSCASCRQNTRRADVVTQQEEKTTISSDNFVNDYDHFSYKESNLAGIPVLIERVNSVSKYCRNNFEEHREKLSDHVPIKLTLW